MNPIWLVNKFYSFYITAIVSIVSRYGLELKRDLETKLIKLS